MRCPGCDFENQESSSFCIECGAPFERRCFGCGFSNPPHAKFCGRCGSSLTVPIIPRVSANREGQNDSAGDAASRKRNSHDGERRHLTVLFCDLVGSTAMSAQVDPEEWRETVAGYHRATSEVITRFDGHVAKYLGDGIMAYFGWPQAHDNDAELAARAGLAILDVISKFDRNSVRAKLSVRVGIDSGVVVIGKGAGQEADVFGDTANFAARIQVSAEPDSVVISDSTHRLVSGLFVVEDLGARTIKGIARALQLYRVNRPSGMRGRLAAASVRGLTPFIGREGELRLLIERWERVREGDGQVVTVVGEAGIGKSRLIQRRDK